jgi:transposase
MKTPTKFVKELSAEQRSKLLEIYKTDAHWRTRQRAQAILLSARGYSVDQLAALFEIDRDRVSQWLDWWDEHQFDGLDDDPRSGRPPKLDEKEQARAREIVSEEPRSTKQGLQRIAAEIGKTISPATLRHILHAGNCVWKRLRRSLRAFRDEAEFRATQQELAQLRAEALAPGSDFDLWYYDEAGFSLQPSVPYAWQQVGERLELATSHGPRQNILGFFNLRQRFHSFAFTGTLDTRTVVHCFDLFSQRRRKAALVVIDNAPIHTSDEFEEELERWEKDDLYVKFLPAYSPELNLIELLWRKIKYDWLPLDAYQNFKTMTNALFEVLKGVGSKHRITFS